MKDRKASYEYGFTLTEIIITLTLIGIMTAIINPILRASIAQYQTAKEISTITSKASLTIARMGKELISAKSLSSIANSQISFNDFDGNTITYRLNTNNVERQENSGGFQPLTDEASSLSFKYYDANLNVTSTPNQVRVVIIALTLANSETSFSLQEATFMENLS